MRGRARAPRPRCCWSQRCHRGRPLPSSTPDGPRGGRAVSPSPGLSRTPRPLLGDTCLQNCPSPVTRAFPGCLGFQVMFGSLEATWGARGQVEGTGVTLGLSLQSSILGRAWRGNSFSKSHAMASEVHAGPRAWRSWLLELGPPPGTPRVLSPGARGLGRRLCSSAPSERVGPAPATVSLRRLAAFRARSLPAHPGLSGAGADGEGVLRGVLGAEDEVGRGDRSCPLGCEQQPWRWVA